MIKRIMIFGVLASLLQLVFYVTTTFIVWHLISAFYKFRGDWTNFVVFSVFLFGLLLFVQNILIEIIIKKWNVILLFIITLIIYIIGWGEDYEGWPVYTILVLITGSTTLLLKFVFDLNYKNQKSKIVNLKS